MCRLDMGPARFERATSCSGGKRSIQLSYGPETLSTMINPRRFIPSIGAAGFEPATSCSRSRRATRLRYAPSLQLCAQRDSNP